jgi:transcriptional regulator with XRE-family HTH domain
VYGNTSATRSTYGRYERDEIDTPDPATVRELCEYLDVNTVDAFLALGWISREDLDKVIAGVGTVSEFADNLRKVAGVLNDPSVPRHYRAALDHTVASAYSLWENTVAMSEPREPSGAELDADRKQRQPRQTR